jgi:hypothetical protein
MPVLGAVAVAGVVASALTLWAVARSPILVDRESVSLWRAVVVASNVAVGLFTWWRRPEGRFGPHRRHPAAYCRSGRGPAGQERSHHGDVAVQDGSPADVAEDRGADQPRLTAGVSRRR